MTVCCLTMCQKTKMIQWTEYSLLFLSPPARPHRSTCIPHIWIIDFSICIWVLPCVCSVCVYLFGVFVYYYYYYYYFLCLPIASLFLFFYVLINQLMGDIDLRCCIAETHHKNRQQWKNIANWELKGAYGRPRSFLLSFSASLANSFAPSCSLDAFSSTSLSFSFRSSRSYSQEK